MYCWVQRAATTPGTSHKLRHRVVYSDLQVVDEVRGTIEEAACVLRPDGHLCFALRHPTTDLGHFVSDEVDALYTVRSAYFESTRIVDTIERGGLNMTF